MNENLATGYKNTYELFNSEFMRKFRAEAYDEDLGQHSWITGSELRSYIPWLALTEDSVFLDFGCGPGGPLTFIAGETGAEAVGIDLSAPALQVAQARAAEMKLSQNIKLIEVDGNQQLQFPDNSFDAVVSFDVVLHLQERELIFAEWRRVLKPGGRVLFTDAGILTGPVSDRDIKLRSINGYTQFVPVGYNLNALDQVGFKGIEREQQSQGPVANAAGRSRIATKYKAELIDIIGQEKFDQEQEYLQMVVDLYERQALTRFAYRAVV